MTVLRGCLCNVLHAEQWVSAVRAAQDTRGKNYSQRVRRHAVVSLIFTHPIREFKGYKRVLQLHVHIVHVVTSVNYLLMCRNRYQRRPQRENPYLTRWKTSLSNVLKFAVGSSSSTLYTA